MRNPNVFKVTVILVSICISSAYTQVNSEWRQVLIGGGGRTFGFQGSPSSDMLYLRTDVAGMYKKLPGDPAWTRLTDTFDPGYGERMEGCAGLGLHPETDDILYAALSRGIYKSTDGGVTWRQSLDLRIQPNGSTDGDRDDRNYGEALVVDQYNGEVVYYGSQLEGLFYTRDGGSTWTVLDGDKFPMLGSRSIVVDNTGPKVDVGTPAERAQYVYVTVKTKGIYRSEDGGNTFSQWTATLPDGLGGDSGNYVRYLRASKDGELYACHNKGLARWDGTAWTDISPVQGPSGINIEIRTVATDPLDNNVVICASERYTNAAGELEAAVIYRSNDRGDTWEAAPTQVGNIAEWGRGRYEPNVISAFSIYIDDQVSAPANRAYISSSYHAWKTDDIWAPTTVWDCMQEGNEMTINITGVSLPGIDRARLITGMADIRGFVYYEDDLDQYPAALANIPIPDQEAGFFTPNFPGIDFCESDPSVVWFTATKKPGFVPLIFKSENGGDVIRYNSNPSIGTSFENTDGKGPSAGGAKIAVSATDPDNAVIVVKNNVLYTKDGGTTWTAPTNLPTIQSGLLSPIEYEFDDIIQSDRVNGNTFYLLDINGDFYRSTNGGETFDKITGTGLRNRSSVQGGFSSAKGGGIKMAAAPGIEGELWVTLGANGVWKASGDSLNRTNKFEEITFFKQLNPTCVTFGAPKPGTTTPTAYVSGARRIDGLWGIWKSGDLGANWELVTPIDVPGQWIRNLYGDREVYGRVFVGDASYGVRSLTFTDSSVPDVVVDNDTPGFQTSGSFWAYASFASGGQVFEGDNYRVNRKDEPGTATYTPTIVTAGSYNVYARWISTGDRDSTVQIDINDGISTQRVTVDQRQQGGQWVQLATVDLAVGNSGFVRINNDVTPGKVTIADAVRWEFVPSTVPLRPSGFEVTPLSFSSVRLNWFDNASNEEGFIIERSINQGPFEEIAVVEAGLSSYTDATIAFNNEYEYSIRAFNANGESLPTFVEFNNTEIIVDNDTPGFQAEGSWAFASFVPGGQSFYGPNYRVNRLTSPGTATYTPTIGTAGIYDIYGRWIAVSDRDDSVKFEINTGMDTLAIFVDQRQDGGKWVLLTTKNLQAGTGNSVVINNDTTPGKVTVADAVRFAYVGEYIVNNLQLTSMCSEDPGVERRWRVRNPNLIDVPVYWQLYGTTTDDNIIAPPGDSFFVTPATTGSNTVKIVWKDETGRYRSTVKASGGAACPGATLRKAAEKSTVAIELSSTAQVLLYPNPARYRLNLVNVKGGESYQIYNLQGISIQHGRLPTTPGEGEIDTSQLIPGLYLLKISNTNIRFNKE